MTLLYGDGLTASVTDVQKTGTSTVNFKVGTGDLYKVLSSSEITADVIIEFTSDN